MVGSGTDTFLTYNAKPDLAKVYPYTDIHKSIETYVKSSAPIYAPLSVKFSQLSTELSYTATRKTVYDVLQLYGSYLAFCNFLVGIFLAGLQKHTLNKSFIKKLYSANPKDSDIYNS